MVISDMLTGGLAFGVREVLMKPHLPTLAASVYGRDCLPTNCVSVVARCEVYDASVSCFYVVDV